MCRAAAGLLRACSRRLGYMPKASGDRAGLAGPLEDEVVRIVWRSKRAVAVREVLDRLNANRKAPLAYTTVMTVMTRLAEKGVLIRRKVGRGYAYEAAASDAAGLAVNGVIREFGDAAVAHFVDQARADPKLMRRLRRLVEGDG